MSEILNCAYHSRNSLCKTPFGAVLVGTEIQFNIFPERSYGVKNPLLWVKYDEESDAVSYPMRWISMALDRDQYHVVWRPESAGLYWYYFSFESTNVVQYIVPERRGRSQMQTELTSMFQLTVYNQTIKSPDWFGEGITYQVFPDRFYRDKNSEYVKMDDRWMHDSWDELPVYLPDAYGEIRNNDFFGGTLQGIEEKLPYLKQLGVRTIYLNPIFEASSNHRYDTADYKKVDPYLGTQEDFVSLCAAARRQGMRIVLDGVFSHTGFHSRYFNGRGTYDELGAYQSQQSKYASWYDFQKWPDVYSSWWGIYTLPQVNEMNDSYLDFIIRNEDSVIKHWLRLGASGWRLDVADELPDAFIEELTRAVKSVKEDAIVIGEVWEDASNKIAYSQRRRYFLGKELDSVMNYPLRNAIIAFLRGSSACEFAETIEALQENYPKHAFYNLMNLVGTHDTERILTILGATIEECEAGTAAQASMQLTGERLAQAKRRLKLAAVLQFTMPGSPTIYYGDEIGMQGFRDPLCRKPFAWGHEDAEISAVYQRLCQIRNASMALKRGQLRFLDGEDSVLGFVRSFGQETLYVFVNRGDTAQEIVLEEACVRDLLSDTVFDETDVYGDLTMLLAPETAYVLQCDA